MNIRDALKGYIAQFKEAGYELTAGILEQVLVQYDRESTFGFQHYSDDAMRTASENDFLEITKFIYELKTQDFDTDAKGVDVIINKMRQIVAADEHKVCLMYDALGLAGEAGEVADYIKKVVGHGKPFDPDHVEKELGDVLWYINRLTRRLGKTLQNVALNNIKKLKARYPHGFSHAASQNRPTE